MRSWAEGSVFLGSRRRTPVEWVDEGGVMNQGLRKWHGFESPGGPLTSFSLHFIEKQGNITVKETESLSQEGT